MCWTKYKKNSSIYAYVHILLYVFMFINVCISVCMYIYCGHVCQCAKQYPHRRSHPIGAYFPEEGESNSNHVYMYVCECVCVCMCVCVCVCVCAINNENNPIRLGCTISLCSKRGNLPQPWLRQRWKDNLGLVKRPYIHIYTIFINT